MLLKITTRGTNHINFHCYLEILSMFHTAHVQLFNLPITVYLHASHTIIKLCIFVSQSLTLNDILPTNMEAMGSLYKELLLLDLDETTCWKSVTKQMYSFRYCEPQCLTRITFCFPSVWISPDHSWIMTENLPSGCQLA